MSQAHMEPEVRWLGNRRFWQMLAVLVVLAAGWVLARGAWLHTRRAPPVEVMLVGQSELTPGVGGKFRVLVRNARASTAIPEARLRATLRDAGGRSVWSGEARTDASGFALVEAAVPASATDGSYRLALAVSSNRGSAEVDHAIEVRRTFRVLLSTDKPLYQPGQTIHMRALALATFDLRPAAGLPATIEVKDGKGNKVFKHLGTTSDFGLVAGEFVLADQVNTGSYSVSATVGDTTSERTVTVERYVLPRFALEIHTDRAFYLPGETIEGAIVARYTFGEPVARGKVRVAVSEYVERLREIAVVEGETNTSGRFAFRLPLKEVFAGVAVKGGDALVSLEATVVDAAGHRQTRSRELTISSEPIRIDLVPEGGHLVPGVDNTVWVVTSYPDGRPARTEIVVAATRERIATSEAGVARLRVLPDESGRTLTLTATDAGGASATVTRQLAALPSSLLVRPDRAIYSTGEAVRLAILAPAASGRVFVDVVKTGRTVLTQALDLVSGFCETELDLPPDLFGTLEIRAFRLLPSGELVGGTRIIQVNPPQGLHIDIALDRSSYRPGEQALLRFTVTRPSGAPAVAALGLSAVDEAVFALQQMRPGLERVFFMLQEELLRPRFEIHAAMPPSRLTAATPAESTPGLDDLAGVVLSAAAGAGAPPQSRSLSVAEKQASLAAASQAFRRTVVAGALLLPAGALAAAGLPFLLYLLLRLLRRQPLGALPEQEVRLVGRTLTSLSLRLVVGVYALLAVLVLAAVADSWVGRNALTGPAIAVFAGVFLLVLVLLVLVARRLRRLPAAEPLPFVRRLAALVPAMFALVPLAVAGLVAAAEQPWQVPPSTVLTLLAAGGVSLLLVVAALGVARACAERQISCGRYLAVALTRPLVAVLPLVLGLSALLIPLGRSGKLAGEDVAGLAREDTVLFARAPQADAQVEAATETREASSAGEPLKTPSRVRRHFPETLLWIPELITGADGRAQVELPLADSITTWRLAASAVSTSGELGAAEQGIRVHQDFFVDLDLPVALTQHDEVSVPVAVYSYLPEPQTVRLELAPADWYELRDEPVKTLRLAARQVTSVSYRLVARTPGRHVLTLKAAGTVMADAVEREVRVAPDGEETIRTWNGTLERTQSHRVDFPPEAIAGASDLYLKIYPGAFSQVVEGLDSILRMPFGCFEQTSSATYPNVLALSYLRATGQVKPEIEMKALGYINTGYQRLLSFEVPGGGFSWFGQPPAHNVLTAYGVLLFADLARVHAVDPAVLARTTAWLGSQQQPDGSFAPTRGGIAEGAINQYQGQTLRTTAYVAWALAAAGQDGESLARALTYLKGNLGGTQDPYTLAVAANALVTARDSTARGALERLLAARQEDGDGVFWTSSGESAVSSRGDVLAIETTAIAAQALLGWGQEIGTAHRALAWLIKHKDSAGTWHSTQATVHAMRALLAGSGPGKSLDRPASITVIAGGRAIQDVAITPETSDVLRLVSLREAIAPVTEVTLETAGAALGYQLVAVHYLPWRLAAQPREPEISIDVSYDRTSLRPDDTLGATVAIRSNRAGETGMTIVDLGVPPGFEVLPESLDALTRGGLVARYSRTGRQIILYFDTLPGQQEVRFRIEMKARFPVRAKTPPATIYQYYEPSVRNQSRPVELVVQEPASRAPA